MEQSIDFFKNFGSCRYIDDDFIMFRGLKKEALDYYSNRIDEAVLGVCTNGHGKLTVNMKNYDLNPHDIMILSPGAIVKEGYISDDLDGLFISCSKKFCDEVIFQNIPQLVGAFMFLNDNQVIPMEEKDYIHLHRFYEFIWDNTEKGDSLLTKEILRHLLTAMALWLYSLLPVSQHGLTKNRQESIVEKFLQDAQDQYKQERRVGYYAQLQFITPKYLSMVVKLVTGKTVSDWINSFVILAAKSQLKNTIKTIQEIAVELNFPNQSFFGKYFKKNTGMSPSDYRSSN